jgi:hypothetical protein
MSRPPSQHNYVDTRYHPGETIDFKVPAIGTPYDSDYPSVYAQAGFPGYAQQLNTPGYNQQLIASNFPYQGYQAYPGYPPGFSVASAYQGYTPIASPATLPGYPALDSEAVHERIRNNIDAIMETQKTAMLNSKLENLTNKVQSLAHNIESSDSSTMRGLSEKVDRLSKNMDGDSTNQIKSLSDKVERLSRNFESRAPIEPPSSTLSTDGEIARRLRRLAAESSSSGRPEDKIPDW